MMKSISQVSFTRPHHVLKKEWGSEYRFHYRGICGEPLWIEAVVHHLTYPILP